MFSPQRITRATAAALTVGAIVAPAASAMPIGGNPPQTAKPVAILSTHFYHPLGGPNHSVPAAANPLGSPTYSQQDKQLVPSSPTQAPVTATPTAVPVSNHPIGRFGPRQVSVTRAADNSPEAALRAGAVVLSILGLGGALALSQHRRRKPTVATA